MKSDNLSSEQIPVQNESDMSEALRRLVRSGVMCRRQAIIYEVARSLLDRLRESDVDLAVVEEITHGDWERIESLSQLRATVGGRFQNLKKRWVKSGFPLREHRGDREGKAEIDEAGWVELSLWINKQGFETKLAADSEPWLLEVRKIPQKEEGN
ncbi:MAG: hypothetical protein KDD66_15435 [Bdellovibrionales bacterium]|nr:hypothetical protein [Bdellovibrionales bacterium]